MAQAGAENGTSAEVSIGNAYCVVYKLVNQEWAVTGQGWAQVHLYRDSLDGTHRIVGWTVLDFEVVINCNVTATCKYKKKSDDFHKFTDDENITYGFGFYKKEESVNESKRFMAAVLEAIKRPIYKPETQQQNSSWGYNSGSITRPPTIHAQSPSVSQHRLPSASISKTSPFPLSINSQNQNQTPRSPTPDSPSHNTSNNIPSTTTSPPPLNFSQQQRPNVPQKNGVAALTSRFEKVSDTPPTVPTKPSWSGSTRNLNAVPSTPSTNSRPPPVPSTPSPASTSSSSTPSTSSPTTSETSSYAAVAARSPPSRPPPPSPSLATRSSNRNSISTTAPTRPVPVPPTARGGSNENNAPSTRTNGTGSVSGPPSNPTIPRYTSSTSQYEPDDSIKNPTQHQLANQTMDDIYQNNMIPLGKLKILPAKPTKHNFGDSAVTDPNSVIHTQHVKYDVKTRSYKGLPKEWEQYLNQQFGLPPDKLETIKVAEYKSRIPTILVQMKDYLVANGGLDVEGIFRIAPDQGESTYVKQQLNENKFEQCNDVSIIANLIKVWYRDLPVHILDGISQEVIIDCETEDKASKIISSMSEPSASYFLWLLDLCCQVSSNSGINKMSSQNLAIVIGPNLFTPNMIDPMASLLFSQKVATFMHKAVEYRRKHGYHEKK